MSAVRKLVAFYRYIYLNQPQLTRLAGMALILAVGSIHLVEAPEYFGAAAYLSVLLVAAFAGTLVSAFGIMRGAKSWGWTP